MEKMTSTRSSLNAAQRGDSASTVSEPVDAPISLPKRIAKRSHREEQRSSGDNDEAKRSGVRSSVEAMLALVHAGRESNADDNERSHHVDAGGDGKKRKTTHSIRKQEITLLASEAHALETRLAFLRGEEATPATEQKDDDSVDDPVHPYIPNSVLREAVHEQQLSLAGARSLISQYLEEEDTAPIHTYVHLPKTTLARERLLRAIKPYQIRVARRYVLERSRHLNIRSPHAAGERFINTKGDAINSRFSLVQFPGSLSVREVFEAASFYTSNLEISFTDGAGRVTIREQEDVIDEPTMSQHHFLTTVNDALEMEGNLIMLSHFDTEDDYGICTSTFVDKDELHPYRPTERVRQDLTAVFMVSREKDLIVMRRMGHVRVHHNEHLDVSETLLLSLSEGLSRWGDAMVQHVRHKFGLEQPEKYTDTVLL